MSAKEIQFSQEARGSVLKGINILVNLFLEKKRFPKWEQFRST